MAVVTWEMVRDAFAVTDSQSDPYVAREKLSKELAPLFNIGGGGGGGAVDQVAASLPITVAPTSGVGVVTVGHAVSGVLAGSYGDDTHFPVVTVDATGHVSAVSVRVLPLAGSAAPLALGVASPGSSTAYAREDHVHPMPTAVQVGAEPGLGNPSSSGQVLSSSSGGVRTWIDRFPLSATGLNQIVVGDGAGGITSYPTLKGYSDGSVDVNNISLDGDILTGSSGFKIRQQGSLTTEWTYADGVQFYRGVTINDGYSLLVTGDIRSTSITPEKPLFVDATTNKLYGRSLNLSDLPIIPPGTILGNNTAADSTPLALTTLEAKALLGVSGGPFLPLAAGASSPLSGELYASQGVRVGANMLLRDLVGVAGFGAVYGTTNSPTDANYLLAFQADGSEAYFNATSKIGLDIAGNDILSVTGAGVDIAGTIQTDLPTGFVRSSSGVLSASPLASADITGALGYTPVGGSGAVDRVAVFTDSASVGGYGGLTIYRSGANVQDLRIGGTTVGYLSTYSVGSYVNGLQMFLDGAVKYRVVADMDGFHVEASGIDTPLNVAAGTSGAITIAGSGSRPVVVGGIGSGFVRSSGGTLSASALLASEIPNLDASKIVSGTFADARIASAATWNAKLSTVTADATSRAANTFYAAPNGAAGTATFRAIVAADVPTLNQNTTGSAATLTTARTLTIGSTGKTFNGSANVSWSLAEIGAASAASLGNYLPLASGSVHAPGSYTASGPTLGIGDGQYGLSAQGGDLYLHASSGGRVIATRDFQSNGAVIAATSLAWPGASFRDYTDANYTALYGALAGTPASNNYSLAIAKNGSEVYVAGSSNANLVVGSTIIARATASGLAVTGELYATTRITAGAAQMSSWSTNGDFARFGHSLFNTASGFGYIQHKNGEIYLEAPTSAKIHLRVAGSDILKAEAGAVTVYGGFGASGSVGWAGGPAIPSSDYVVQGSGSGTLGHRTTKITATATPSQSGFYDSESPADGPQGATWTHMIRNMHTGGTTSHQWMFDIAASFGPGVGQPEGYYVRTISAGSTPGWRTLYHSGSTSIVSSPAHMGQWGVTGGSGYARFGHKDFNGGSGFGYLQNSDGSIFIESPSGKDINFRVAGSYIAATLGSYFWTSSLLSSGPVDFAIGNAVKGRLQAVLNDQGAGQGDLVAYSYNGTSLVEGFRLRGWDNTAWFTGHVSPSAGGTKDLGTAGNYWNNLFVDGIRLGDYSKLSNNGTSVLGIDATTELPVATAYGQMIFIYAASAPSQNIYIQSPSSMVLMYSTGTGTATTTSLAFNSRAAIAIAVPRYNASAAWYIIN